MPKTTAPKKPSAAKNVTKRVEAADIPQPVTEEAIALLKELGWTDYPNEQSVVRAGKDALTIDQIKTLLGYEEEPEGADWGDLYYYTNYEGKKVRLNNNDHNRRLTLSHAQAIAQDILNRVYRLNMENAIFGKSGRPLSFQHRGIGAIEAELQRIGKDKYTWQDRGWDAPVTLPTSLGFGCSEDPQTVRTIDNTSPRGPEDMFYTEREDIGIKGKGMTPIKASKMAKILKAAVTRLWDRVWQSRDNFDGFMTNSSCYEFAKNHKHLVRFVEHVYEENGTDDNLGYLKRWMPSLGDCAALLYLMASRTSDAEKYYKESPKTEKSLKWDSMDKAEEFFVLLSSYNRKEGDQTLQQLFIQFSGEGKSPREFRLSNDERIAMIILAFNLWIEGRPITAKGLELEYKEREKFPGQYTLMSFPTLGGIDKGKYIPAEPVAPTPEEIAQGTEEAKKLRGEPNVVVSVETRALEEQIDKIRQGHEDKVLLFVDASGALVAFTKDSGPVASATGMPLVKNAKGLFECKIPLEVKVPCLNKLHTMGKKLALVSVDKEGNQTVTDWIPKSFQKK